MPQVIDFHESVDGSSDTRWWRNVQANAAINKTRHQLGVPGKHALRIWMVDAGVVMDKIVINLGGLKESYLGPPETLAPQR